jgi:glycosyltransferase involved in cell wall biosynthesis
MGRTGDANNFLARQKLNMKIAVVVSHPIQHFCPQYVSWAEIPGVELQVFFASMLGLKKYVDPNFKQEISWSNLQIDRFNHIFLNGEKIIVPDKNLDAPGLDRALTEFSPQVVIGYGYYQRLQRRAYSWARKNKVPVAYISDSEMRQKRSIWKALLKYPFLRWYFSKIDFFLTVGNANESFYLYYGVPSDKFIRMHFPIDIASYSESYKKRIELRKKIRSLFDIAKDEIVLCVVGKLVQWKSQSHIIQALTKLEKGNIKYRLFVLGSGPDLDKLKDEASALSTGTIIFPGFVDIAELPAYYAATDIYVHPAEIEPHSIAISEAIYMGCPVVISDRCGSYGESDDVEEHKNGVVFPYGNIDSLAQQIALLASNDGIRQIYSEVSHQLAVEFQHRAHHAAIRAITLKLLHDPHD